MVKSPASNLTHLYSKPDLFAIAIPPLEKVNTFLGDFPPWQFSFWGFIPWSRANPLEILVNQYFSGKLLPRTSSNILLFLLYYCMTKQQILSCQSILQQQGGRYISTVGLTIWNLSCLEFKFDDTRLSYWHKNKIGRIKIFFVASWLC